MCVFKHRSIVLVCIYLGIICIRIRIGNLVNLGIEFGCDRVHLSIWLYGTIDQL